MTYPMSSYKDYNGESLLSSTSYDHGKPLIIAASIHARKINDESKSHRFYYSLNIDGTGHYALASQLYDTYDEAVLAMNERIKKEIIKTKE